VGDDTEIRRLAKETKKRRQQTEHLNRRVHRLNENSAKNIPENPAKEKPPEKSGE
jgi:hypothetical protein